MQGSTVLSPHFSAPSLLCVCTNPLLRSLAALNCKHIVSSATDGPRCFTSCSLYMVCVTATANCINLSLHRSDANPTLCKIIWGEMWRSLMNHLINLRLEDNSCWKRCYLSVSLSLPHVFDTNPTLALRLKFFPELILLLAGEIKHFCLREKGIGRNILLTPQQESRNYANIEVYLTLDTSKVSRLVITNDHTK